jgi:SAM-dependent methyltransferase
MTGRAGAEPLPTAVEAVAAAFDRQAETYDRFADGVIGRTLRARVHERLLDRFRAGHRVLELNCGTGVDAVRLAQHGVRVVATDVSAGMLARARRNVEGCAGSRSKRSTSRRHRSTACSRISAASTASPRSERSCRGWPGAFALAVARC